MHGFVASCSKKYVDEIEKQDLFDYMAWLGKQKDGAVNYEDGDDVQEAARESRRSRSLVF